MEDALIAERFARLEAQVKMLSDQLGVACPPFLGAMVPSDPSLARMPAAPSGVPAEVLDLAREGKTIHAISALRRLTGATLAEAKRIVENL